MNHSYNSMEHLINMETRPRCGVFVLGLIDTFYHLQMILDTIVQVLWISTIPVSWHSLSRSKKRFDGHCKAKKKNESLNNSNIPI